MTDTPDSRYGSPQPLADVSMDMASDEQRDSKKPRVRHSEAQLAALNDLFDEDEHPALEQRAALAQRLGMDSKAVNAWFANKRSASKKKVKPFTSSPPPLHDDLPPPHAVHVDHVVDHHRRTDGYDGPLDRHHSRMSTPLGSSEHHSPAAPPFPALDSDRHVFDSEISTGSPRRVRVRPTPKQTEELRRLYSQHTHPSREEREALGDRIGMKLSTVTNWFQNQRSLARRRAEEEALEYDLDSNTSISPHAIDSGETSPHHRASLPPASIHPSLGATAMLHGRSPPVRSHSDGAVSAHDHHKIPPAIRRIGSNAPPMRPRRTRPEPYQLEALKKLFARTPNPSIEERGALALEIDMELSKVTNWFRNLRQTARKKAQKANPDGEDGDFDFDSAPVSRLGTPMLGPSTNSSYSYSSSSASQDGDVDHMELDGEYSHRSSRLPLPHHHHHHIPHHHHNIHHNHHHQLQSSQSDGGSEEEDQEAVTPPPPPAAVRATGRRRMDVDFLTGSSDDLHAQIRVDSSNSKPVVVAPPKVEDALLLLSFSQHVSH